jgi:hypothetical protein
MTRWAIECRVDGCFKLAGFVLQAKKQDLVACAGILVEANFSRIYALDSICSGFGMAWIVLGA